MIIKCLPLLLCILQYNGPDYRVIAVNVSWITAEKRELSIEIVVNFSPNSWVNRNDYSTRVVTVLLG